MSALAASAQKVQDFAAALGLDIAVREMAQPTRTAEEAAAACGVTVGQIVKSLVFLGATSGQPYLLLVWRSSSTRIEEAMATESPKVRTARNESLFREVNERIDSAGSGASPMFTEFMCECADDSCFDYISLTSEEYSSVRNM